MITLYKNTMFQILSIISPLRPFIKKKKLQNKNVKHPMKETYVFWSNIQKSSQQSTPFSKKQHPKFPRSTGLTSWPPFSRSLGRSSTAARKRSCSPWRSARYRAGALDISGKRRKCAGFMGGRWGYICIISV